MGEEHQIIAGSPLPDFDRLGTPSWPQWGEVARMLGAAIALLLLGTLLLCVAIWAFAG